MRLQWDLQFLACKKNSISTHRQVVPEALGIISAESRVSFGTALSTKFAHAHNWFCCVMTQKAICQVSVEDLKTRA